MTWPQAFAITTLVSTLACIPLSGLAALWENRQPPRKRNRRVAS
jgi:hypothetical protein